MDKRPCTYLAKLYTIPSIQHLILPTGFSRNKIRLLSYTENLTLSQFPPGAHSLRSRARYLTCITNARRLDTLPRRGPYQQYNFAAFGNVDSTTKTELLKHQNLPVKPTSRTPYYIQQVDICRLTCI